MRYHLISNVYSLHLIYHNDGIFIYCKSPARSRMAYIRARIVEGVHKSWLLFGIFFPDKKLEWGGLYMKYSIFLSIFIYRPWLVNEGGLNMRVAHHVSFFPNNYKPCSNISHTASDRGLMVVECQENTKIQNWFRIVIC